MNFRQVHLDFHTSEKIPGIGSNFSKEQFQAALKTGHVNSITVFSKCHHGWAYHPSTANEMHPGLSFDLLEAEIEAAHEIGVKTPVYISAGFDEKISRRHPEWLRRPEPNDTVNWITPQFHELCMNTPYLDYLLAQIEEVVQKYDCDGIFLDIVGVRTCYCQHCVQTLLDEGKDPYDEKNAAELGERVYLNYTRRVREAIDKYKPGLPVFHNGGHIRKNKRELAYCDSHLELESLPTGGWGYDHFPLSSSYARTLGLDFLGMTGKFHMSWGEFGGFKHPNALRYEEALCVANGAKCSIGDQMHPDGHMDETTYSLIGAAYSEVEAKEPWLDGVESVADIAVLSQEAVMNYFEDDASRTCIDYRGDDGVVRVLLEGHFLFDFIDTLEPLDKYKLVILPDTEEIDDKLSAKLKAFTEKGGKVLASGRSGLIRGTNDFAFSLDRVRRSAALAPVESQFCTRLRMVHGHGAPGEAPAEILAFADHFARGAADIIRVTSTKLEGNTLRVKYTAGARKVARAELLYTKEGAQKVWHERLWQAQSVPVTADAICVALPEGTYQATLNLISEEGLITSSRLVTVQ